MEMLYNSEKDSIGWRAFYANVFYVNIASVGRVYLYK